MYEHPFDKSMFSLWDETFSHSMSNETIPGTNPIPERCARHQPSRQHPRRRSDSSALSSCPPPSETVKIGELTSDRQFDNICCVHICCVHVCCVHICCVACVNLNWTFASGQIAWVPAYANRLYPDEYTDEWGNITMFRFYIYVTCVWYICKYWWVCI